jgi:hypothetical protein
MNIKILKSQCPFCGEIVEYFEMCNGFCKCGAKYYFLNKTWLNRNTGEEIKEEDNCG